MMKALCLSVLVCVLASAGPALALDVPKPGKYDHRVRMIDYNPLDVVKVIAHYGYQVNVVLEEDEAVVAGGVFLGDADAWKFGTHRNHLFLKAAAQFADTNLTVLTTKGRAYNFILSAHENKKGPATEDMFFQVRFRYPEEEAKRAALLAKLDEEDQKMRTATTTVVPASNWNYSGQGSEMFMPDSAYDNGTFTYLTFSGNRQIPAIFVVNEDGSESLVNRHVEGNTVVIHTTAARFVLRKGNSVTCVFNDSFNPKGGRDLSNGATVPTIERVTKGVK